MKKVKWTQLVLEIIRVVIAALAGAGGAAAL